jgi:hypothetical protein
MKNITVEVSDRWVNFAKSPLRVLVAAGTCVALSFAPAFLFNLGRQGVPLRDPRVLTALAVIILVPLVYIRLGALFIAGLNAPQGDSEQAPSQSNPGTRVLFWLVVAGCAIAVYLYLR